ncbi:MAG TPA: hypothetical protein VGP92_03755 [Acidimicrobiia bacterium]|jgi:hypothetical protein|nr:hypothetical protein [Acidimicrobiia bacterium]
MRRLIALLVGATSVFVLAARPVAAEPTAPAPGTTSAAVPADAIGLSLSQVSGSGLAVTLDPGASEEHDLVVSNHTANLRLTIKLTATDATGNLGTAAASWLTFGDDAIQLDPHAATTVPMTIAVPHDTQPASALAHVNANVESAVAAADGSPVAGTANQTFPVSIAVRGTPTAQIAIADVHRVDQGSRHQLAVVLRNFGAQGAQVSGHVRVAGDKPQTLPFHANLEASRDTTVDIGWDAPPVGAASDIAVDLEYGGGNVASWSSRLGGAPTDLSPPTSATPTSVGVTAANPTTTSTAIASAATPWWKQPIVTILAILALLGAALWFVFEMRASSRRREWVPVAGRSVGPPGWAAAPSDESIDLARQMVRLTEVIVELVATHRDSLGIAGESARARSPDNEAPIIAAAPSPFGRTDTDELQSARAGPAPPVDPVPPVAEAFQFVRSASVTPGASSRPEPVVEEPIAQEPMAQAPIAQEPVVDPNAAVMERLRDLDRQRLRFRDWMDAEESGQEVEPPGFGFLADYAQPDTPGDNS